MDLFSPMGQANASLMDMDCDDTESDTDSDSSINEEEPSRWVDMLLGSKNDGRFRTMKFMDKREHQPPFCSTIPLIVGADETNQLDVSMEMRSEDEDFEKDTMDVSMNMSFPPPPRLMRNEPSSLSMSMPTFSTEFMAWTADTSISVPQPPPDKKKAPIAFPDQVYETHHKLKADQTDSPAFRASKWPKTMNMVNPHHHALLNIPTTAANTSSETFIPLPPMLKRQGSSWTTSVLSQTVDLPPRRTTDPRNSPPNTLLIVSVVDKLEQHASGFEQKDHKKESEQSVVELWEKLRAMVTGASTDLTTTSLFATALQSPRYLGHFRLLCQLLLTLLTVASVQQEAGGNGDAFVPLLNGLVTMANSAKEIPPDSEVSFFDWHQVCLSSINCIVDSSSIPVHDQLVECSENVVDYLMERLKEKQYAATQPLCTLVYKLRNGSSLSQYSSLVDKLQLYEETFWDVLMSETESTQSNATTQAMVELVSLLTIRQETKEQTLGDSKIRLLLNLCARLQSSQTREAVAAVLVRHPNARRATLRLVLTDLDVLTQMNDSSTALILDSIYSCCTFVQMMHYQDDHFHVNMRVIVRQLLAVATRNHNHSHAEEVEGAILQTFRCIIHCGGIATIASSHNCLSTLITAIHLRGKNMAEAASFVLLSAIKHDPDRVGVRLSLLPSVSEQISIGMHCHVESLPVVACLCATIEAWTLGKFEQHTSYLEKEGFPELRNNEGCLELDAILDALHRFPLSNTVTEPAFNALSGLLKLGSMSRDVLKKNRARLGKSIQKVFGGCQKSARSTEAVLNAWICLGFRDPNCLREVFPLIPRLLDTMHGYIGHIKINTMAFKILTLTAWVEGPSLVDRYPTCVRILINSLLHHHQSSQLVLKALTALITIAAYTEKIGMIFTSQDEADLLLVAKVHVENPTVLAQVLGLFNNMLASSRLSPNDAPGISQKLLRFVIFAMDNYKNHERIQQNACRFLFNGIILDTVKNQRSMICRHGQRLKPFVYTASIKFPSCRQRAGFILRRLHQYSPATITIL